jgi:hypothetical protein
MKRLSDRMLWGIVLVVFGVLFLLRNLGIWGGLDELVFGVLFGCAGVVFVASYLRQPKLRWWSVIPGCALLGLGSLILLSSLPGRLDEVIGGPLFLGSISLAFLIVFFTDSTRWWALIPGGTMATVALVALVEQLHIGIDGGSIMMFGLAATFGLLSLINTPQGRLRWALIPAGVLAALGVLILSQSLHVARWLWPLAIVLVGVAFVVRSLATRREDAE